MYHSAQRQFINFCTLDGCQFKWFFNEETLLPFCSHLEDHLHHSSIKVYLSAIRSLHIDQGFPDPLVNCLQLQCPLRGIKRHQGSTLTQRQPVTSDLMRIIQRSLDTHNSEHVMLWAACCLGFFGFLRAGEFTVNSTFDPSIHLTIQDLQVDVEVNPSGLCVCIKSSKNDLFPQGCFIYLGCALSTVIWSPVHRHPWSAFNSFSSVFLHPVCVTGGGNPWAVFKPLFLHWGRYGSCAMQHSRSPYQDHGRVDQ